MDSERPSDLTGIFKLPVRGSVRVTRNGLAGDTVSDTENHGGADQAVYLYGMPDYEWWTGELGRELAPGTFGENLTVTGLESARANVGDRLYVGTTVLEVTAPRIPCYKLAAKMGDPAFVKRFREAERPGVYCRVVREGEVREGDGISYEPYSGPEVGNLEMFRDAFDPARSEETIRRHLAVPISSRARAEREGRLEKILGGRSGESGV